MPSASWWRQGRQLRLLPHRGHQLRYSFVEVVNFAYYLVRAVSFAYSLVGVVSFVGLKISLLVAPHSVVVT